MSILAGVACAWLLIGCLIGWYAATARAERVQFEAEMQRWERQIALRPSFACPRCGARSAHPDDIREGYCGRCHDWTAHEVPFWDRITRETGART